MFFSKRNRFYLDYRFIDHFSKFMMFFPVEKNDSVHIVNCLHEFCAMVGYPKILQSDNGSEYKNDLMEEFCIEHNIKLIFSSPHHWQSIGIIEVTHKEIRKNVILYYSKNTEHFNLKNVIINAADNHNRNIHTITKYRSIELINNTSEEVYNKVIENIKNSQIYKAKNYVELSEGNRILIEKNCVISNKRLITRKFNIRDIKIVAKLIIMITVFTLLILMKLIKIL